MDETEKPKLFDPNFSYHSQNNQHPYISTNHHHESEMPQSNISAPPYNSTEGQLIKSAHAHFQSPQQEQFFAHQNSEDTAEESSDIAMDFTTDLKPVNCEVKPSTADLIHSDTQLLLDKGDPLSENQPPPSLPDKTSTMSDNIVNKSNAHAQEGSTAHMMADAGIALTTAACSVAKCEALIKAVNECACDKFYVSVLCKLKTIKDCIGNLMDDLSCAETGQPTAISSTNIPSDNITKANHRRGSKDTQTNLLDNDYVKQDVTSVIDDDSSMFDEYLVKAELPSDEEFVVNGNEDYEGYGSDVSEGDSKASRKLNKAGDRRGKHRKKRGFSCPNCDDKFKTSDELKDHKIYCQVEGNYSCDQCTKTFPNHKRLNRHVELKHMEIKCDVCDQAFDKKRDLLKHRKLEKHYPDAQKVFCDKCNKMLLSMTSYKKHIEHFHSKNHVCRMCHEAFDALRELREHMKNIHEIKLHNLFCGTCGDSFDSVRAMHQHMNETNHSSYTCEVCSKAFTTEHSLKTHIKNQHSQNFKCDACDLVLDSKMELKRHVTAEHVMKNKQYVCQTCGHSTKNKDAFRHHLLLHGAKRHKCEFCEKSFHMKHALTTHMRVHTGEKPYVCQVCGARFRKNGGLSRHKLVHTGEKPFVCYLCGKGFTQRSNLKTHMKSHINNGLTAPPPPPLAPSSHPHHATSSLVPPSLSDGGGGRGRYLDQIKEDV